MTVHTHEHCNVVRGHDCEGLCETRCFRCGISACPSCSVVIPYLRYGNQRIGLDCLDEMARTGEGDLTKNAMPTHRIENIHRSKRHPGVIYACLVEVATGESVISATLDYILDAIRDRNYIVAEVGKL